MALNYEQPGDVVEIAKASVKSGDPIKQNDLTGVSLCDTDDNGNIRMATVGVFELTVKGKDDGGNVAVNLGDKVYYDGGDINKDTTNGTLFGKALGTVSSSGSAVIRVLLIQA